jgi:hypothetical protein
VTARSPLDPIPGRDPGACPDCGSWRKAGILHVCAPPPADPVERLLAAARNPDGTRRFYPPEEHPATDRLRRHRELLAHLPETAERDKAIAYVDENLARFAAIESRAQGNYLRAVGVADEREDWPVHQPEATDAPIPGRHWYSCCEPLDYDSERGYYGVAPGARVNPATGLCENCGRPACRECGRENCPDHQGTT